MPRRLGVLTAIFLLAGVNTLHGAGLDALWLGVLWTKGDVSVGDAKVTSGTTVLPGDVITTSQGASAWLRFRSPASMILLADSQAALFASDPAPSLALRRGSVVVDEKVGDPFRVAIPGAYVLLKGSPQTEAECEVAAVGNESTVSVRRGLAEVHGLGGPVTLYPGQSVRIAADPQGGAKVAGKISKEIPQGEIKRQGEIKELPLNLNEQIDWNDVVRTLQTGRAQITLTDGSTLNVGARSTITVLQHDPAKQQTEIELISGKVHATAEKITTPGGKFELHTKSAVIGTIDTSYVAETDDKVTRVCGVKGTTLVKSSDPNIPKAVKLRSKQCVVVILGSAPSDPVYAPSEMEELLQATAATVGGGASVAPVLAIAGAEGGAISAIVLSPAVPTSPTTP